MNEGKRIECRVGSSHASLDRRSFLKGAAVVGAITATTTALSGCAANQSSSGSSEIASATTAMSDVPSWLGEEPVIADSDITQTIEADIVVLGSGNAGVMCATAAVEAGATVSVIEMQAKESIWWYGLHDIASINSDYVLSHGGSEIKKSEFIAEYQRRMCNRTNPRLVKQFVDNSGEMLDWIVAHAPQEVVDKLTIENLTSNAEYFEMGGEINKFKCWNGCTQVDFQTTAPVLIENAETNGATWYWSYTGIVLVKETKDVPVQKETTASDGTVTMVDATETQATITGLIAQDSDGNYVKFTGTKGVVLAGGDYGGNSEMYVALQHERHDLYANHGLDTDNLTCAMFGRDGSGIKLGCWAGGTVEAGPHCLVSPNVLFESVDFPTNVLRWGSGFSIEQTTLAAGNGGASQNPWGTPFVCLDSEGKRFTDETFLGIFGTMAQVERRKPGRYYFFFDNKWAELMSRMAPEHFSQPVGVDGAANYESTFATWVEAGAAGAPTDAGGTTCAWAANSLEELYGYMGFDGDMKASVQASLDTYNAYCENGDDEDFGRDPKMLLSVAEPPFYGMYSVEEKPMVGTVALNGLVISDDQEVLDVNFNPIEGLYACGNNSGGRFAVEYSTAMSGCTLGFAMTLGRVLGKQLAAK